MRVGWPANAAHMHLVDRPSHYPRAVDTSPQGIGDRVIQLRASSKSRPATRRKSGATLPLAPARDSPGWQRYRTEGHDQVLWTRRPKGGGGTANRRDVVIGLVAVTLAGTAACTAGERPRSAATGSPAYASVPLPAPSRDGTVPLERAIGSRRSAREFSSEPLPLATFGQLLWAGQGITDLGGKRTAPSAGAPYPLELYVVTANELFHYLPDEHRAQIRAIRDLRRALSDAPLGQEPVTAAPAVVVIAAAIGRTKRKYGARRALRQFGIRAFGPKNPAPATGRGLVSVPIGAFDPAAVAAALALPSGQTVLYLIPGGSPPSDTPNT